MDNNEESKSVWSKAIPFKEQVQIFKRVLKYVKPFKVEMGIAIFGAFLVSVINMLLPRGLQFFLDNYLIKRKATVQIIVWAGLLYGLGTIIKAILQFVYQYLYEPSIRKIRAAAHLQLPITDYPPIRLPDNRSPAP